MYRTVKKALLPPLLLLSLAAMGKPAGAAVPEKPVVVRNASAPDVCLTPGGPSRSILVAGVNLDEISSAEVLMAGNRVPGITVRVGRAETGVRELRLSAARNVAAYDDLALAVTGPANQQQILPVRVFVRAEWSAWQCAELAALRGPGINPESQYPEPTPP
jgi:hypothetical protein